MQSCSLYLQSLLFCIAPTLSCSSGFSQKSPISFTPSIDFSYAGYKNGETELPSPPSVLKINPTGKDDSALIQAAVNHLKKLPLKENGFRGAVKLSAGIFYVTKPIDLTMSGVVIRGSGKEKTTIIARGKDRYTLIRRGNRTASEITKTIKVVDEVSLPAV